MRRVADFCAALWPEFAPTLTEREASPTAAIIDSQSVKS
jgi:hypothetical protein